MRRSASVVGVAAAAAAAVGLLGAVPASATAAPGGDAASASAAAGFGPGGAAVARGVGDPEDTKKVTLITGDQVWLTRTKDPKGKTALTTRIEQADRPGGEKVTFVQWGTADEYYVVPSDVLALVGSRVDRRIFDVAGLIESGANDSSSTRVIVSFAGSGEASVSALDSSARVVTSKAGSAGGTVLSSANAVALSVAAGKGQSLFDLLAPPERGANAVGQAGVSFVSLDGRVKALDTKSMPQIGAPTAWKSGYTGKGVKVAVLDTGIDSSHPDLRGQVVADKNFTTSNSATDRYGHGTHVASIIAGTGKASNRSMRGVAYQAKLLNAKVLGDDGRGYDSDIIKGMEWAAKSGADVVNLSLGGGPGDGTDPMDKSVNALSKKYRVLFAVAAGNGGRFAEGGVTSPSTADAALSVAAVDSQNRRADFSDSGPRRGDSALKPDIAAPGVEILGARSKVNVWGSGSSPYVPLSGTSMATPHVAGAAAVLAQARPNLSGAQLKSALMGSATDRAGSVWEEGTGVINVPGAIKTPVLAYEGSLSYGVFSYPQSRLKPRIKTIHYHNTSRKAMTLTLRKSATNDKGRPVPGVKLSTNLVRIPAGGWAKVQVTITPGANPAGTYTGAVTATPNWGHAIRTTFGWVNDVKRYSVRVSVQDRLGRAGLGWVLVADMRNSKTNQSSTFVNGGTTLRLPAGPYFAASFIRSRSGSGSDDVVLGLKPQFTVTKDLSVVLGGKSARRLSVKTPRPSKMITASYVYTRADASRYNTFVYALNRDDPKQGWVTPTSPATVGFAKFSAQAVLVAPGSRPAYDYRYAYENNRVPPSLSRTLTTKQVATVAANYRAQSSGTRALVEWLPYLPGAALTIVHSRSVALPSRGTTYLVGGSYGYWTNSVAGPVGRGVGGDEWSFAPWGTYAPGSTSRANFLSGVMSPGAVSGGDARRSSGSLDVSLPLFEDSAGRATRSLVSPTKTSLAAYVGSKKVASTSTNAMRFPVPQGRSVKFVQKVDRSAFWWKTGTATTGEWTVPIPRGDRVLPMMNVQYRVGQTLGGYARPGKQRVVLTVSQHTDPSSTYGRTVTPKTLKVEWSIDGGKTWRAARVARSGSAASATFTPPKRSTTTMVSLRTTATDGKGSMVRETVKSAYRVRAK